MLREQVSISAGTANLEGELVLPDNTSTIVIFAHGSGSSRFSPRNNYVASVLHEAGIGTLLFDMLTRAEDRDYEMRFDIELLTRRLIAATEWVRAHPVTHTLNIGYFGASTGAAAALVAAAGPGPVTAVVYRGGRPDLADGYLRPSYTAAVHHSS